MTDTFQTEAPRAPATPKPTLRVPKPAPQVAKPAAQVTATTAGEVNFPCVAGPTSISQAASDAFSRLSKLRRLREVFLRREAYDFYFMHHDPVFREEEKRRQEAIMGGSNGS